jgi:hypothetical protein
MLPLVWFPPKTVANRRKKLAIINHFNDPVHRENQVRPSIALHAVLHQ